MGAGAKAVGERKGLTMKERLHKCQQTERQRITFGKVSLTSPTPMPKCINHTPSCGMLCSILLALKQLFHPVCLKGTITMAQAWFARLCLQQVIQLADTAPSSLLV